MGEPSPELVARARDGEEEALRALVTAIHPTVHRWALLHAGSDADADDVAQATLVRMVRGIGGFRGEARFTSWLYRLLRNADLDRRRARRTREAREASLEAARDLAVTGRPPADDLDRQRLLARVKDVFRTLPARQREIFDMADLQGLSSPEIAERLGIRPSSVRGSLLQARRSIREQILASDPELVEATWS